MRNHDTLKSHDSWFNMTSCVYETHVDMVIWNNIQVEALFYTTNNMVVTIVAPLPTKQSKNCGDSLIIMK